jgi:hypothetical protein
MVVFLASIEHLGRLADPREVASQLRPPVGTVEFEEPQLDPGYLIEHESSLQLAQQ